MPKYLIKACYNAEGTKALQKEGGTARRTAVKKSIAKLGGTMEAFYYAYGDTDVFVIADLPDTSAAIALSLTVNASGVTTTSMVPLILPEEIDAATKKKISYRAPGKK